jgi:glycerate kinase
MVRVVVASDKFKGTLTSAEVAAAVGAGVRRVHPDATVVAVPVADGGDGTLAAAVAAGFELVPVTATGPTGESVHTSYARRRASANPAAPFKGLSPPVQGSPLVYEGRTQASRGYPLERGPRGAAGRGGCTGDQDVAVVELADVSGLVRLPGGVPAPLTATSFGTGEVIAAAIDAGCTRIILGIGGSASTDGGQGLIEALSGRPAPRREDLSGNNSALRDENVPECGPYVEALRHRLRGVQVVVACDVDNPLTGPRGAAAVYGPQKGADPQQVAELDARLSRWADLVARETGRDLRDTPGAGAAGGVGFAALALLDAELRPGIELVLDLVGFREQLEGADLIVTGEGALDEQTLHGKAVAGVAAAARTAAGNGGGSGSGRGTAAGRGDGSGTADRSGSGVPVVAVCGVNRLEPERLREIGVTAAYALTDLEPDVRRCIAEPRPLLERLGERIAAEHLR